MQREHSANPEALRVRGRAPENPDQAAHGGEWRRVMGVSVYVWRSSAWVCTGEQYIHINLAAQGQPRALPQALANRPGTAKFTRLASQRAPVTYQFLPPSPTLPFCAPEPTV